MTKLMLVALMLSMVLLACAPAQGQDQDWRIACDLGDEPWTFNNLSDNIRWKYLEECGEIPQAPEGYTWINDDLTLAPLSLWGGEVATGPERQVLDLADQMYAHGHDDHGDFLVDAY